jgi:hypothetical protein
VWPHLMPMMMIWPIQSLLLIPPCKRSQALTRPWIRQLWHHQVDGLKTFHLLLKNCEKKYVWMRLKINSLRLH